MYSLHAIIQIENIIRFNLLTIIIMYESETFILLFFFIFFFYIFLKFEIIEERSRKVLYYKMK